MGREAGAYSNEQRPFDSSNERLRDVHALPPPGAGAPLDLSGERERLATAVDPASEGRWVRKSVRGSIESCQRGPLEARCRAGNGKEGFQTAGNRRGGEKGQGWEGEFSYLTGNLSVCQRWAKPGRTLGTRCVGRGRANRWG